MPSKSPIQSRENTERSNFGVGAGALDSPFGEWIGFGLYKYINIFLKGAAMPDIQKSMKLSLAFGLSGAVILPVLYEVYANISAAAGLVLIAVWAVCAGAKFSALKFKKLLWAWYAHLLMQVFLALSAISLSTPKFLIC